MPATARNAAAETFLDQSFVAVDIDSCHRRWAAEDMKTEWSTAAEKGCTVARRDSETVVMYAG